MGKKSKRGLNMQRRPSRKQQAQVQAEAQSSGGGGSQNTTYYVHGPRGIHSQQKNGEWKWMAEDGLGSVRSVVDDDAAVHQSIVYDPFGNPIDVVGSEQTMFGYTGEPIDKNGLVYLRERYYSPGIGTFISQDRVEGIADIPMSLNRYSYVQGNPVNMTDPGGTSPHNAGTAFHGNVSMSIAQIISSIASSDPRLMAEIMNSGMCNELFQQPSPQACIEALQRRLGHYPSIRQIISQCFWPAPTPPSVAPTPTLPVQTLVPPGGDFVTPTPIPGAQDAYYCYAGAQTPGLPPNLTCVDPLVDAHEEIVAHVLLTEAQGSLNVETMANVAQVIWNRRGTDIVGGARNPATIVQRSAPTVSNIRDVAFSGILKAVDRGSFEWGRALSYATALMRAHYQWTACNNDVTCQTSVRPDYGSLVSPNPQLGNTLYYCAVDINGVNALRNAGALVFFEETSPGTYHAYTARDCSEILR